MRIFNSMAAFSSPCAKISLSFFQKSCFASRIPPRQEGRIAIVTTREAGCDGRGMSQHVLHMRTNGMVRTVKSCGPGIPVLMPSS
jgi:hypothetical protein